MNVNRKQQIRKALWLQTLLENEVEEEEEETSSEEDESIILKSALIRRLNIRYLKTRLQRVVKELRVLKSVKTR